jgi:hypothetical protein
MNRQSGGFQFFNCHIECGSKSPILCMRYCWQTLNPATGTLSLSLTLTHTHLNTVPKAGGRGIVYSTTLQTVLAVGGER